MPLNLRSISVFCCFLNFFILLNIITLRAQENTITAGFQFKPIFSSKFFNTGPETREVNGLTFTLKPRGGFSAGMVLRRGITQTVSLETGINYVKRNYSLSITDTMPEAKGEFSMVSYDIPLLALVFIRLSDNIFMDVGMGVSVDFFPSDLKTKSDHYEHYSAREEWVIPAILANLGWEYRTEKSGYIYLGASFHRPFGSIYGSFIGYPDLNATNPNKTEPPISISGNFLTADVRYFFHSDPLKKRTKKRK